MLERQGKHPPVKENIMTNSTLKVVAYKHYTKNGIAKTIAKLNNGKMAYGNGHLQPPFKPERWANGQGYSLDTWQTTGL